MQIDAKQLAGTPKKVGKFEGQDVFHLVTKGGLSLLVAPGKGGFQTLGTGGHVAVARAVARKLGHDVTYTELSKADYVPEAAVEMFVPKYVDLTLQLRRRHGEE